MLNNPRTGFGWASDFQSSGLPWVTSSNVDPGNVEHWHFPKVSRTVHVRNLNTGSGENIAVAFTNNGALGSNVFVIPPLQSEGFELRVVDVYVTALTASSSYSVMGVLTTCDDTQYPMLTGSLWEGVG